MSYSDFAYFDTVANEKARKIQKKQLARALRPGYSPDDEKPERLVWGKKHVRSDPYKQRDQARNEERKFKAQEKEWWSDWEADPRSWTKERKDEWNSQRRAVEDMWAQALKASMDSGYEYVDRNGYLQNKGKQIKFLEEVIRQYLENNPGKWKYISQ